MSFFSKALMVFAQDGMGYLLFFFLSRTFVLFKDENGTEISRTEPNRFLYLIRSNSYFFVRLYHFHFRILDVSYFKYKSRKRF